MNTCKSKINKPVSRNINKSSKSKCVSRKLQKVSTKYRIFVNLSDYIIFITSLFELIYLSGVEDLSLMVNETQKDHSIGCLRKTI